MTEMYESGDQPKREPGQRNPGGRGERQDEYTVGYRQPPLHSRFKPGNKQGKGRKKGSKNLKTIVNEAFGMKRRAKVDGVIKNLSKIEIAMNQLANRASEGDLKAIGPLIELYERHGPQEDPAGPSPEQTRANVESLRDYLSLLDMFASDDDDG